jgi:hypothetical protein
MGLNTRPLHLWFQILDGKSKVQTQIDESIATISGTGGERELTLTIDGSLSTGDCAYATSARRWKLSQSDDGSTVPCWGVVTSTAGTDATVMLEGFANITDYIGSFTDGEIVYVGDDGRLTNTLPANGLYLQKMGYVVDTSIGRFEVDPDDTLVKTT